jgi:hypothetical protein
VIEQVPGASEKADEALRVAKQLNQALDQITTVPILRSSALGQGRTMTTDLIDLLEHVKK